MRRAAKRQADKERERAIIYSFQKTSPNDLKNRVRPASTPALPRALFLSNRQPRKNEASEKKCLVLWVHDPGSRPSGHVTTKRAPASWTTRSQDLDLPPLRGFSARLATTPIAVLRETRTCREVIGEVSALPLRPRRRAYHAWRAAELRPCSWLGTRRL